MPDQVRHDNTFLPDEAMTLTAYLLYVAAAAPFLNPAAPMPPLLLTRRSA